MIASLFTPILFQSTAQAITPILFAALAGVLCGRVGVFNLALEGQMLVGAIGQAVEKAGNQELDESMAKLTELLS